MLFPDYIKRLTDDLAVVTDKASRKDQVCLERALLADNIINNAIILDNLKLQDHGVYFKFLDAQRNSSRPPVVNDAHALSQGYADDAEYPLEYGESWNQGRRATHTGVHYRLDADNKKPINPYMNTGLTGRGVLGQYGPNHAVDIGLFTMANDSNGEPALHVMGITRKYDNDARAFAGGFVKYGENVGGGYSLDEDTLTLSRTEEFFEEMVSGSIELKPEYVTMLSDKIEDGMSAQQIEEIKTQVKLQQVRDNDIGFLQRLNDFLAQGRECFAGPVLNDSRNTNQAWIETQLSWVMFSDEKWNEIKGDNPRFDYKFAAGDDASGVKLFKMDADLIANAYASHGPMFAFMAASFLAENIDNDNVLTPTVMKQLEDIAAYLSDATAEYAADHDATVKSTPPRLRPR